MVWPMFGSQRMVIQSPMLHKMCRNHSGRGQLGQMKCGRTENLQSGKTKRLALSSAGRKEREERFTLSGPTR